MEQWTNDIWLAMLAAFIIGFLLGYVVLRATNANVQRQHKLEQDLKSATDKIDQQKEQLEQHFQQSAALLANLAEDYKKLYSHLATGSRALLPEDKKEKIGFFEQPQLEHRTAEENSQPKDYSEGSSGLLKS